MTGVSYDFASGDLLASPNRYVYTAYLGRPFIAAWQEARAAVAATLELATAPPAPKAETAPPGSSLVDTEALLEFLADRGGTNPEARRWLQWMIQRFEVSKRVHAAYETGNGRARGNGAYRNIGLYLRLAEVLVAEVRARRHLPSLNALLKCLDTLCSRHDTLDRVQSGRLAWLLDAERQLVADTGACARHAPAGIAPPAAVDAPVGRLGGVAFLAADTIRSRGYAQALVAHGVKLARVVIIEVADGELRWGQSDAPPDPGLTDTLDGYFRPDLGIPLAETCALLSDRVEVLRTGTINSEEVSAQLSGKALDFVIYSGFGGELVGRDILGACPPLLHMHAGWLPDYRGSTTTYYSWLQDGVCGVSAIFLSPEIDEGAMLGRKIYPPPASGMDSDYFHDAVLRSDMLLEIVGHLARTGALPQSQVQDKRLGETYYIIHPVLKHLAIL